MRADNQLSDSASLLDQIQTLQQQLDHTRTELQLLRTLVDHEFTGIDESDLNFV